MSSSLSAPKQNFNQEQRDGIHGVKRDILDQSGGKVKHTQGVINLRKLLDEIVKLSNTTKPETSHRR